MIADQRLWRTVDGAIVAEGDPAAAFLVAGEGCEVPLEHRPAVEAFLAGGGSADTSVKLPRKKEDLLSFAAEHGIDVDPAAKAADIRSAVEAFLAGTAPEVDETEDAADGGEGDPPAEGDETPLDTGI